ncbi:MAG TPA: alpha/beta hydrolase [Allosphingosinicella sp.]|nr:alpha/beta hydrolase [Allosphingosinicella sp.]
MKSRDFLLGLGTAATLVLIPAPLAGSQNAALPAAPAAQPLPPVDRFSSDRISVVVQGTGPDVILIPGLTASRDMWKGTVAATPGYRYHLVQVNGFAGTAAGGNASGPVVGPVADEIARYIRHHRLDRPALIGHSMGGTLAMMIAARQPQLAGRVMVVDMLPQPSGLFGGNASGWSPLTERLASSPAGRRLLGNFIGRFGADEPGRASDPDVVARATHDLVSTDLAPELSRIAAPLTVLYAAAEGSDRTYAAAYRGKAGAKLVRIDNSGHMIMYDQPARFRAEMKAFLAD